MIRLETNLGKKTSRKNSKTRSSRKNSKISVSDYEPVFKFEIKKPWNFIQGFCGKK
mgnify:CR=1 FL=1